LRNTIISSIRQGIRNAIESVVSALAPIFYWPGTHTLEATTGTDPTFTRATAATFEDFEGVIRTVESQEPRFQGARRVENRINYSEDLTKAPVYPIPGWSVQNGGTIDNASTFTFAANAQSQLRQYIVYDLGETGAGTFAQRVEVKGTAGQKVRIGAGRNGQIFYSGDITLTGDWQLLGLTGTTTAGGTSWEYLIRNGSNGLVHTINVRKAQFEITTGQTNQNPSEYVSTGVATGPELASNVAADWIPNGGGSAVQDGEWIVITGAGAHTTGVSLPIPTVNGGTYLWSMEVELLTATAFDRSISVITAGGGDAFTPSSYSLISSSQTVTYSGVCTDATSPSYIIAHPRGVGLTARIRNVSVKQAEHGANVDGVQYFNTLNANTVTSNVVTEAVGSPLTRANTQFGDLHGVGGDYFSTPNVVTTWPELDIRVRATRDSQNTNMLFGKDGAGQRAFQLYYAASGAFLFYYSEDGSTE